MTSLAKCISMRTWTCARDHKLEPSGYDKEMWLFHKYPSQFIIKFCGFHLRQHPPYKFYRSFTCYMHVTTAYCKHTQTIVVHTRVVKF